MNTDELNPTAYDDDDLAGDMRAAMSELGSGTGTSTDTSTATPPDPAPVQEAPRATETAEQAAQRARDERGRFAPQTAAPAQAQTPQAPAAPQAPAEPAAPVAEAPAAPVGAPPPGWSIAAKTAFAAADPAIQAAVVKREEEVNRGLAELQNYRELRPFADMARARGDTLPGMIKRYAEAENALAHNTVPALLWLCKSYNVDPRQLAQVFVGQGGQPQPGQPQPQPGQQPQPQQPRQQAQPQNVAQIVQQVLQEREIGQTLNQFLSNPKYKYAQNLRPQMAHFLDSGLADTLEDAYDQACWAHPEIRALLIKEQAAPAPAPAPRPNPAQAASNARAAAKSVTGTPLPGASTVPSPNPDLDIADQLRAAMRQSRAQV